MDQVEGIFRPRISFKYLAGNSGIKLGSGQLLQQGGFFSLLGFQESGKIVLRQQYGTRKLFEGQADQFDDTGLQIGTRPLLFLLLVEVVQRQTRILQPSVFLVTRPRHRPACPVAVSVQGHEIHLCKTRSRPPPQQETGIALRQLFITDILKLDIIFFAWSERGVRENRAKHIASKSVDLPAPVGPEMAKIPAESNGSTVKSISKSPSSEARLRPRIANIFIGKPPVLHR